MSFDLTNKNIKDTYQNLLQKTGSNHQLYDLVGNPIENLTIQGTLYAQSYIVSESVVNTSSGSTIFGDSFDDIHIFTGSISASGNISASGTGHFSHLIVDRPFDSSDEEFFQIKKSGTTKFAVDEDGDIIKYGRIIGGDGNPNQFDGTVGGHTGFTSNYINFNANPMEIRTGGNVVLETTSTTAKFNYPLTVNNITASGNLEVLGDISGSLASTLQVGGAVTGEMKHMFFHSGNWSSGVTLGGVTTVYIPLNSTVESSTIGEQHQIIAPFNGSLLKIVFRALGGSNPGNMTAKFQKNGVVVVTEDITGVTINNNAVFSFSTNNAFNAGDVLALALNVVTDTGDFIVTSVFQFDTNTIIS